MRLHRGCLLVVRVCDNKAKLQHRVGNRSDTNNISEPLDRLFILFYDTPYFHDLDDSSAKRATLLSIQFWHQPDYPLQLSWIFIHKIHSLSFTHKKRFCFFTGDAITQPCKRIISQNAQELCQQLAGYLEYQMRFAFLVRIVGAVLLQLTAFVVIDLLHHVCEEYILIRYAIRQMVLATLAFWDVPFSQLAVLNQLADDYVRDDASL